MLRATIGLLGLTLFLPGTLSAQVTFTDVTAEAGVQVLHTGALVTGDREQFSTGAAWLDYDGDGDLDLYVTQRVGANHLFANNGDGTFTDVAGEAGAADALHDGAGVSAADYDNDGDPDLYLANVDADVLLRNDGGTFVDVTAEALPGVMQDERGTTPSWGDYDRDGDLDLYIANHVHALAPPAKRMLFPKTDYLLENNGDGTFSDASWRIALPDREGFGFVGGWTDYDGDGDPDLFLINDCPYASLTELYPVKMLRNDGSTAETRAFTEAGADIGAGYCDNGMGLAVGDYDGDDDLDYFYTNIGRPKLLANQGGSFLDVTDEAGLGSAYVPENGVERWTWGTNFFDADLDGWVDLYIANGTYMEMPDPDDEQQPNQLFLNAGDGTFTDVTASSGADDPGRTRTSIAGDYDGDGDVDLFVVNHGGAVRLLRNDTPTANAWLALRLVGTASNRDGLGAQVRLATPDGQVQRIETRSGSSLGGGDAPGVHAGLGVHTAADVTITWPSGIVQALPGLAAGRTYTVTEAGVETRAVPVAAPIVVPAEGGTFAFTVTLRNLTERSQVVVVRGDAVLPDGRVVEGVMEPVTVSLSAGAALEQTVTQQVPARAPSGAYRYVLVTEGTDGTLQSQDAFAFEKEGSVAAGGGAWGVVASGQGLAEAVAETAAEALAAFALHPNYPNPFNPVTTIRYTVPVAGPVRVAVYDLLGRRVRLLAEGPVETGTHAVRWDGRADDGHPVASGVYLYRLEAAAYRATRTLVLLR